MTTKHFYQIIMDNHDVLYVPFEDLDEIRDHPNIVSIILIKDMLICPRCKAQPANTEENNTDFDNVLCDTCVEVLTEEALNDLYTYGPLP